MGKTQETNGLVIEVPVTGVSVIRTGVSKNGDEYKVISLEFPGSDEINSMITGDDMTRSSNKARKFLRDKGLVNSRRNFALFDKIEDIKPENVLGAIYYEKTPEGNYAPTDRAVYYTSNGGKLFLIFE